MMALTWDEQGPMKGHLYDKPTSDIAPKTHRSLKTNIAVGIVIASVVAMVTFVILACVIPAAPLLPIVLTVSVVGKISAMAVVLFYDCDLKAT